MYQIECLKSLGIFNENLNYVLLNIILEWNIKWYGCKNEQQVKRNLTWFGKCNIKIDEKSKATGEAGKCITE